MAKLEVESWSALEVKMDAANKSFTVVRGLKQADLGTPGLKPTFIFYTSQGAQIIVNEEGTFLLRFKYPKGAFDLRKKPNAYTKVMVGIPKLSRPPENLKRLAKKAMKQLFLSGKVTRG